MVVHDKIWKSGAIQKFSATTASTFLKLVTSCEKLLESKTPAALDWQGRTDIRVSDITRIDASRFLPVGYVKDFVFSEEITF